MSQVAKCASAFVRAFLAILVLELEDIVVRLVRPPKLVNVHGDRWTVRMSGFVDPKQTNRDLIVLALLGPRLSPYGLNAPRQRK